MCLPQRISRESQPQRRISAADHLPIDRDRIGQPQPPSSAAAPDRPGRAGFIAGFGYAWLGIVYVVRTQRNARVHLAISGVVVALGAALRISRLEWALLLVCMVVVIATEMINTVAEAIVDLTTDRYHPLAKVAKDVAAGTVLFTAAGAVLIGLLVLGPHLWGALFG